MQGSAATADAPAGRLLGRLETVDRSTALLWCLVVGASLIVGYSVAVSPATAIALAAGLVIAPLLVVSPGARLAFVVLGGVAVLNVSEGLTPSKVVYLFGCSIVVGGALLRLGSLRQTMAYAEIRPVLHASFVFALFIVSATVLSILAGNPASGAVRESSAYLLFASVPLLALDSRLSTHPGLMVALFTLVGVLGSVSYALEWISRRGLTEEDIGRVSLSGAIPGAVLCLLTAAVLLGKRRILSAAGVGIVLALVLITGNRAGLLLLLGPLTVAAVGSRGSGLLRLALVGPLAIGVTYLSLSYLVDSYGIDSSTLTARYASLTHPSSLGEDQSVRVRLAQTEAARSVFESHPVVGAGPGFVFVWTDPITGLGRAYPYVDSPLQFPAKFGVVGLLLLGSLVYAFARFLRRLMKVPDVYRLALVGFCVSVLASAFVAGTPMEDKGFTLSLLLLLSLSLPIGKGMRSGDRTPEELTTSTAHS